MQGIENYLISIGIFGETRFNMDDQERERIDIIKRLTDKHGVAKVAMLHTYIKELMSLECYETVVEAWRTVEFVCDITTEVVNE